MYEHILGVDSVPLYAPDHWASYLINNDDSAMGERERVACDAWREREGILDVLTVEGEPFFTWSARLHVPELECEGATVCTYRCRVAIA